MLKRVLYLFVIVFLFNAEIACKIDHPKIERAFYYWKSDSYSLGEKELNCLKNQEIKKLYVKFFDIVPDPLLEAVPVSKTELHIWDFQANSDTIRGKTRITPEIVPTVYIKNEAVYHSSKEGLDTLAGNVLFLINKKYSSQMKSLIVDYKEIQIDCDWTEKTKDNYFYLLRKIKEVSKKTISCTLRLYPYKYRDQMGVPPVDKAVLMCYNLISPLANDDKNSILSASELEKYLINTPEYPLHLDIALPIFSWMQVYQNNRFVGLINPQTNELDQIIKPLKPLWFEVTKDKELGNQFLRVGDKIKYEEITVPIIKEAISLLKKYVPASEDQTIILFHLDANNIDRFDNETLDSFFTDFMQ
jgi:hypothetical protein